MQHWDESMSSVSTTVSIYTFLFSWFLSAWFRKEDIIQQSGNWPVQRIDLLSEMMIFMNYYLAIELSQLRKLNGDQILYLRCFF